MWKWCSTREWFRRGEEIRKEKLSILVHVSTLLSPPPIDPRPFQRARLSISVSRKTFDRIFGIKYIRLRSFFFPRGNKWIWYSRIIPKSRCLFKFHFIPVPLIRSYPRSILLPLNLARESGNALCPNFHVSNSTLQFVINSGGGTFLFVLSVLRFRNIYTVIRVNSWTGYKKIFYE